MNALMLILALTMNGQVAHMLVKFPSLEACEAERAAAYAQVEYATLPDGDKVTHAAVVCVAPTEVKVI